MKKTFLNIFLLIFLSSIFISAEAAEYYDFDDDDKADILWRDEGNGKAYLSLMGAAQEGMVRDIETTYDVRGISDLNNDSKDDIIIKDSATGDIYVSLMDGLNIIAEGSPADLSGYNLDNDAINNFDWNQIYEVILKDTAANTVYLWQDEAQALPQIPLSFTCDNASEMMISLDPAFTGAVWEPYAEQTSFTLSANDGTKTIYTKFKNSIGEELGGLPVDVIIDTSTPTVNITSHNDGFVTGQTTITVTGTTNEPCFKVLVNDEEAAVTGTDYNIDITLNEGDNTISAVVFDQCGNIGFSTSITVTLDLPPSTPVLNDPGDTDIDTCYTLDWNDIADASGIELYEIQEDTDPAFSNPTTYTSTISEYEFKYKADNTYYYQVRAKDNVQHYSSWSNTVDMVVSANLFTVSIVNLQDGETTDQTSILLTGTALFNAAVEIFVNGISQGIVTVGQWILQKRWDTQSDWESSEAIRIDTTTNTGKAQLAQNGGEYYSYGTIITNPLELNATSLSSLSWEADIPAGTNIEFQTRTGSDNGALDNYANWETWKPTNNDILLNNADDVAQWTLGDNDGLSISQEDVIIKEGTGSLKVDFISSAQVLSSNTTDANGNTHLISNDINSVFYYDTTQDSDGGAWRFGNIAKVGEYYLQFDGTDDYVSIPDSSSLDTGSVITILGWIKASNLAAEWIFVAGKSSYWDANDCGIHIKNSGLEFYVDDSRDTDYFTVATDTWYFVAGVYDGSSRKLYVNGNLEFDTACPGKTINNSYSFTIGADNEGEYGFNGFIDEVAVLNRALTEEEIQDYYSSGLGKEVPSDASGLVSLWHFDEGSGTTAIDSSNNNNGTIYGATYNQTTKHSWYSETPSGDRGTKQEFPEHSFIVASNDGVDIIDADTNDLWMRFDTSVAYLWYVPAVPETVSALNGKIYVGRHETVPSYDGSIGLGVIDFSEDKVIWHETIGSYWTTNPLDKRNQGFGGYTSGSSNIKVNDGHINELVTIELGTQTYVITGEDNGISIINEDADRTVYLNFDPVSPIARRVFACGNDLYYSYSSADLSSTALKVKYSIDQLNSNQNWTLGEAYNAGYSNTNDAVDNNWPLLLSEGIVNDIYVAEGTSTVHAGDNTIYCATNDGLTVIHEYQGNEQQSTAVHYGCTPSINPDITYKILAGNTDRVTGVKVIGTTMYITTSDGNSEGAVSIVDLTNNTLVDSYSEELPTQNLHCLEIDGISEKMIAGTDIGLLIGQDSRPYVETILDTPQDLSNSTYLGFWLRASMPGTYLQLQIGESDQNGNAVSPSTYNVTIDQADTWQYVYWDITDIPQDDRDAVTYIAVVSIDSLEPFTAYLDALTVHKLINTSGTNITSTPNNYVQVKAIFSTTDMSITPILDTLSLSYEDSLNGTFSLANLTLSEGNNEIKIIATSENTGMGEETVNVTLDTSPQITITTPFDLGVVDANSIVVEGNFTGVADAIYVNGFRADVTGSNFIAYEIPLFVGENQIQVVAYREQSPAGEKNITITVNEAKDVIAIEADPLSGEPPLTVNYSLTTDLTENIASYQWDYEGDDIFDYSNSEYVSVSYEYTTEQRYYPRVMITTESGLKFSESKRILVHPSVAILGTISVDQPQDLAIDSERNLYVLEQGSHSILKYDKDGNFIRNFGGYGDIEGSFDTPSGIALDSNGNIYIADTENNRIQNMDNDGYMNIDFGAGGIVTGLTAPYDISVDSEGNVYVTEYPANKVKKYDIDGNFITEWANGGAFTNPAGIIYKYDTLYLANSEAHRIDQYSKDGSLLSSIGNLGAEPGNFESPLNLCYDQTYEKLVVADTMNQRIQLFNNDHTFYREIKNIGLSSPVAVVADFDLAKQIIYIADKGNNQVLKVEILNDTATNNPSAVFGSLQQALSNENINSAVAEFSEDSKEKYQGVFQGLAGHLGEVSQDMNNMYLVKKDENTALYLVVREEEGDEYGYYVYFNRDKNGNWKISDF